MAFRYNLPGMAHSGDEEVAGGTVVIKRGCNGGRMDLSCLSLLCRRASANANVLVLLWVLFVKVTQAFNPGTPGAQAVVL